MSTKKRKSPSDEKVTSDPLDSLGPRETISITWGDQAENHAGMQKIGRALKFGLTSEELLALEVKNKEIYNLVDLLPDDSDNEAENLDATVIVIRGGVDQLLGPGATSRLRTEIKAQPVDKKAKMRGRVVNKLARWNNCYGDIAQEPDYEQGKGTVIAFSTVPNMCAFREALPKWFGSKARCLVAETNDYMDITKQGIGFHGDSERKIVICARFGATMPLVFQWYQNSVAIGKSVRLDLNEGDIYVMSEKATGCDWKKRKICTLRHAAGAAKYIEK